MLEAKLGGAFDAESSDEESALAYISGGVSKGFVAAAKKATKELAGISFDGSRVGIHFMGGLADEPEEAAKVAQLVWSAFLPHQ